MRFFVFLLASLMVRAEVLPLRNGSFEEPKLVGEGQQVTNVITGWVVVEGTAGVFVNNGSFGNKVSAGAGEQLAWLNGTKAGSLRQEAAGKMAPLTTYSARAWVGLRKDTPLTNGASLLLRLQAFDREGKLIRTLGVKEILLGREALSDEKLTEFEVAFTSGVEAPRGSLWVSIGTGELGEGEGGLEHRRRAGGGESGAGGVGGEVEVCGGAFGAGEDGREEGSI